PLVRQRARPGPGSYFLPCSTVKAGSESREGGLLMNLDELIFISVDDHVVEPPHLFDGRMPAEYVDRAPRVVRNERGDDVWVFDGGTIPNIGLNAVAGRPPEEYGVNPTSFEEMRPGCWDIHERVKDMSAGGVL